MSDKIIFNYIPCDKHNTSTSKYIPGIEKNITKIKFVDNEEFAEFAKITKEWNLLELNKDDICLDCLGKYIDFLKEIQKTLTNQNNDI